MPQSAASTASKSNSDAPPPVISNHSTPVPPTPPPAASPSTNSDTVVIGEGSSGDAHDNATAPPKEEQKQPQQPQQQHQDQQQQVKGPQQQGQLGGIPTTESLDNAASEASKEPVNTQSDPSGALKVAGRSSKDDLQPEGKVQQLGEGSGGASDAGTTKGFIAGQPTDGPTSVGAALPPDAADTAMVIDPALMEEEGKKDSTAGDAMEVDRAEDDGNPLAVSTASTAGTVEPPEVTVQEGILQADEQLQNSTVDAIEAAMGVSPGIKETSSSLGVTNDDDNNNTRRSDIGGSATTSEVADDDMVPDTPQEEALTPAVDTEDKQLVDDLKSKAVKEEKMDEEMTTATATPNQAERAGTMTKETTATAPATMEVADMGAPPSSIALSSVPSNTGSVLSSVDEQQDSLPPLPARSTSTTNKAPTSKGSNSSSTSNPTRPQRRTSTSKPSSSKGKEADKEATSTTTTRNRRGTTEKPASGSGGTSRTRAAAAAAQAAQSSSTRSRRSTAASSSSNGANNNAAASRSSKRNKASSSSSKLGEGPEEDDDSFDDEVDPAEDADGNGDGDEGVTRCVCGNNGE